MKHCYGAHNHIFLQNVGDLGTNLAAHSVRKSMSSKANEHETEE